MLIENDGSEEVDAVMMELGRKFSQQAKDASTAKGARIAFDLAERAFKLALKAQKQNQAPRLLDFTLVFLSMISGRTKRSELWLSYNEFCLNYDLVPLRKGEFFEQLRAHGFSNHRLAGIQQIKPPRQKSQLLISAGEKFREAQCNQQVETLLE